MVKAAQEQFALVLNTGKAYLFIVLEEKVTVPKEVFYCKVVQKIITDRKAVSVLFSKEVDYDESYRWSKFYKLVRRLSRGLDTLGSQDLSEIEASNW